MLNRQKLEYLNFSGGISENTVPGASNMYARADNLLITRDRHLETRPGSEALSDSLYILPTTYQRVGSLHNFYNDAQLIAQSGQSVFDHSQTSQWTEVKGPTHNRAFPSNTAFSRVYGAMWRQELYMVSDSGDFPQFLYYDAAGTPQIRTAGLPKPVYSSKYTSASLFADTVQLAVALQTAMLAHMGSTAAHVVADSADVAILTALTQPTSIATLISFVTTLRNAHNTHVADALLNTTNGPQIFHVNVQVAPVTSIAAGRLSVLNLLASTALSPMTEIQSTILVLNDLRNRYNFHTYATITHQNAIREVSSGGAYSDNIAGYGLFAVTQPGITQNTLTLDSVTETTPLFTTQIGALLAYVNQAKAEFNAHLTSIEHNNPDTDNTVTIADATDVFSAYCVLAHLEFFYWNHFCDSAPAAVANYGGAYAGDSNSGVINGGNALFTEVDATITNAQGSLFVSATGTTLVGAYIVNCNAFMSFVNKQWQQTTQWAAGVNRITGIVSGTAYGTTQTAIRTLGGNLGFLLSTSRYHYGLDLQANSVTNPSLYTIRTGNYAYSLQDLSGIALVAQTFIGMLASHEQAGLEAQTSNNIVSYWVPGAGVGQTITQYSTHYAPTILGREVGLIGGNTSTLGQAYPIAPVVQAGVTLAQPAAVNYLTTLPRYGTVIYTAVWRYTYTTGGLSFEQDSAPAQVAQVALFPSPQNPLPLTTAQFPLTLSGLPVLSNGIATNWDTYTVELDLYRSITDGTTLYKVGTVANGVTTFTDTVTDAELLSNQPIYTTGGVLQNDQAPASKFLTILNSTAYYGYVKDTTSGESFPNRVLQSIPFAPYAVPAENFDDLDDELVGLTNFNNYVLAFCKSKIYRMEGTYNELGQGLLSHIQIAPTVGGISQAGLVQTEYGVFFCGTNGIYWTDGFTLTRVTGELEKTYNALIQSPSQRARLNAVYDKSTRRIYWSFASQMTSVECDITYVLDLNWGISERMSFTTLSGNLISPSAWAVFSGQLIRGESYGFLFKHDAALTSDQTPLLGQRSTPSTAWAPQPIVYDYQSCQTNFGSSQIKKWVTRVTYQGKQESNLFLQINRKNNNGGGWKPLVPIRSVNECVWGDPAVVWGSPTLRWGSQGMIDAFRKMPAGSLRTDWMATQFTNARLILCASDTYGLVSTSARAGGQVTLTLPTPYQWPLWAKLYTIAFQNDGYVKAYTILGRTAQTLTVADPDATAPASATGVLWQMSGIPYGQRMNLTAYNISFAPLSDEQSAYHGSTSSDGGANSS